MNEEERPNPDELLKAVQREENMLGKGYLKIFLGMAAGVGKTYAMLESAQKLKSEGIDVVVGIVNTHGRQETSRLLNGLKVVPEKWIKYKDTVFEELDIDEILRLKPQVAIIDELAHSNVPGSRHPKRWQDIQELLDNGINVFTTLNVQHIESVKDIVESISGITIRETVPDSIIESAAYVELLDLTPVELLQRLKEGKVYLGEQSAIAARNFFQEDRLTALREIALRYVAEKVDHDLQGMVSTKERLSGWKPRERYLVAVSPSPHSQKLIRTTRRFAFNQDAPWYAVYVDDGRLLGEAERGLLARNLALARDLGAEVITTNDPDVAKAIVRISKQKGITQIILGRPPRRFFHDLIFGYALLDKLATECSEIDIHVIRQTLPGTQYRRKFSLFSLPETISSYLIVSFYVLLISIGNFILVDYFEYRVIGFIFLLGILFLSLFFKKGPVFFAAILIALIWDLFFIPSIHELVVTSYEDTIILLLFLLTALVTGILTDRVKLHNEMLVKREESIQALYDIARQFATSPDTAQVLNSVKNKLSTILKGQYEIIVKKNDNNLNFDNVVEILKDGKEQAAADWVFHNGKEAGWSTTTLPSSKNLFLPLKGFNDVVGVMTFCPAVDKELTIEEKNFLYTVCQLLGNYLEKGFLIQKQVKVETLDQKEKIYKTVLNLLSNQFQTPIKMISESLQDLKAETPVIDSPEGTKSLSQMEEYSKSLMRVVDNITAMARLSAGMIPINKTKNNIKEFLEFCRVCVKKSINGHEFIINVQDNLPDIEFDYSLVQILVCNLIFNASDNTPSEAKIEVQAKKSGDYIEISVLDEGRGIPQNMLDFVFEKFSKLPDSKTNGLGLGLSIAKNIAELHKGILKAENRPTGGSIFSLYLPINKVD